MIPILKAGTSQFGLADVTLTPESLEKLASEYPAEPWLTIPVKDAHGNVLGEVKSLHYADGILSADISFNVSAQYYPTKNRVESIVLLDKEFGS